MAQLDPVPPDASSPLPAAQPVCPEPILKVSGAQRHQAQPLGCFVFFQSFSCSRTWEGAISCSSDSVML